MMSAFSRGCIKLHSMSLNSSRTFLFKTQKSCPNPRFFTSTSLCRSTARKPMAVPTLKTKSKQKPQQKPQLNVKSKVATQIQPPTLLAAEPTLGSPKLLNYHSYADILAAKPHTTILYQAPSHTGYIVTSYLAGTFLLGFAGLTFWNNYIHIPADIGVWVPYAFAGISFLLAACGGYVILSPAGLIKSITAVPAKLCAHPPKVDAPLYVEVALKKIIPIPFMPPRILTLSPSSLHLTSHLYQARTRAEERAWNKLAEEKKRELAEYDRTHIIGRGTRKISVGIFELVRAFGRCWTRDGFIPVRVTERGMGRVLKLDGEAGWAQDGGRALEKIIKVQSSKRVGF
ncbi:predicted protein [Sclerotinia sclerotiorum 1980 UF-70]|uniref:Uncharacterized protein n=1 Tax=Sclerotinia sclerotiorum (strain ATCC 18683 / 1980 / Ss-1) TaxID=665079 RepID=A7F4Q0_SCLS1|nr:predicted protein [Sclerotinia sclerotiorum 1980 UF-70]EDN97721.1 predicted protein [Sclerotinia sclerotiorum 1980 UF-70]